MSVLEIGHVSWERHDADGVARALLEHACCISVQLVPPGEPWNGWSVCATYFDDPAPRLVPPRRASGGRR
jgi:hypothetical protein